MVQVVELSKKLAALSEEKSRLENRNNILEKAWRPSDVSTAHISMHN